MSQLDRKVGPIEGPRRVVLIIEDDDAIRDAMRAALVAEDYEAISVATLRSARRLLAEVEFDAVLLDVHLGEEHGGELLAELSTSESSPPVLLVSGILSAVDLAAKYRIPLVMKPFDIDHLLSAVVETIAREARPRVDLCQ